MAQGAPSVHESGTRQIDRPRKRRAMKDDSHIPIVEDDEDEDQSAQIEDSDSDDEVDESVVEDMRKLEESFKGISQRYRLINRIGEGDSLITERDLAGN